MDFNLIGYALFNSLISVFVLVIWFETNAFVEYLRSFYFLKFLRIKEYEERDEGLGVPYPDFLEMKSGNFLTRLLACPLCLGVWVNIAGAVCVGSVFVFFASYYLSLIFYFFFKYLMGRSDEQ
ncbi:hypothetical protein CL634_03180 [bacterium]|nr:hypothetical protein [bacterium]